MSATSVLTNVGLYCEAYALQLAWAAGFLSASLYTNNVTLTDSLDSTSFTQPTFPGYVAKQLANTAVGGTSASLSSLTSAPVTFALSATCPPQTIRGVWWHVGIGGGFGDHLMAAAPLPNGPFIVSQAGDSIVSQLTLTLQRAPGQA